MRATISKFFFNHFFFVAVCFVLLKLKYTNFAPILCIFAYELRRIKRNRRWSIVKTNTAMKNDSIIKIKRIKQTKQSKQNGKRQSTTNTLNKRQTLNFKKKMCFGWILCYYEILFKTSNRFSIFFFEFSFCLLCFLHRFSWVFSPSFYIESNKRDTNFSLQFNRFNHVQQCTLSIAAVTVAQEV